MEVHLFGVEVSHLSKVLVGLLEGIHGEEVTWLEGEFTANDIFINSCIAVDLDLVDRGLDTFHDAYLQVDGVVFFTHFYRVDTVEDVTLVVVVVADSVFVALKAAVDVFGVIDIAFLHAEQSVELVGGIDSVADPADVAYIVFLTFVDVDVDVNKVVAEVHHAVADDLGITITHFVIFLDDALLVFLVFLGDEFLGSHEVDQLVLMGFLEQTATERTAQNSAA